MFEDLIPPASAQTPGPSPGMFDDLIPAGGAAGGMAGAITAAPQGPEGLPLPLSTPSTDPDQEKIEAPEQNSAPAAPISGLPTAGTSQPPGLFDDLIPAAAVSGGTGGGTLGAVAPEYEPIPDARLGLKDAKTGIPLVRENIPGRFIAEVEGEDDGGLFWKDPHSGEIRRPSGDELIRPEGGRFKVYERHETVRPWTLADMALLRAIVSGFTAAHDAFAGNMAPSEVIPRALDFAGLASGGARSPVTTWRPRTSSLRPEPEPTAEPTGPPAEQTLLPQNGAPSGAVSVSRGGEPLPRATPEASAVAEPEAAMPPRRKLPPDRIVGFPEERGKAPIGDDGHPVEGHHEGQVHGGTWIEITRTDHRLGKNFKKNHENTGQERSKIDPRRRKREAYGFWSRDYEDGRFHGLPKLIETEKIRLQEAAKMRDEGQEKE